MFAASSIRKRSRINALGLAEHTKALVMNDDVDR